MTIRIEIDANFGGSVGEVTGVFEAFTNPNTMGDEIRTGYLLDDTASEAVGFLLDQFGEDGESTRKGVFVDPGGGQHAWSIDAEVTSGEKTDRDGNTLQWGSTADPDVLEPHSATGGTALQKVQIFQYYLSITQADGLSPARFQWGEYSPDGVLDDYLEVVFEKPKFERQSSSTYRFSATAIHALALGGLLDGDKQTDG